MKSNPGLRITRWLLAAGLATGISAAHAASGHTVTAAQESLITRGMTANQVERVIGQPDHVARYLNETGPSWTYAVAGGSWRDGPVFEVDFDAEGKVATTEQLATDGNR
jgi:outer membrane protein assembly factor BamE (lipoprotein component of BamABCDE complex)